MPDERATGQRWTKQEGGNVQVKRLQGVYLIRLEPGEEVIGSLRKFASAYRVGFAALSAIGTFERVTLGYYDTDSKTYRNKSWDEPVEVLTMTGNISRGPDGERIVHAHVIVGRSDYSTLGGHVLEATTGPTLEVTLHTAPTTVRRQHDADTGLNLWDLSGVETHAA